MPFDIIVPSFDAGSQKVFNKINRGCKNIKVENILQGLIDLRKEFKGELWLEIFIIPGINDTPEELALLKEAAISINPERVQLNSLDRPGVESWIKPADQQDLEAIKKFFKPLNTEIIVRYTKKHEEKRKILNEHLDLENIIINTLRRRPCTAEDLSTIYGKNIREITLILDQLCAQNKITSEKKDRGIFFKV
jgi:wyosine [tRNA(Phe)-imidazoG37] synthetase (radical SAM superfamily)